MKHIILGILALSLISCSAMIPKKQYDGPARDLSEISIVKSYVGNPFGPDYHAKISKFRAIHKDGISNVKPLGNTQFTGHPGEIHLLPGAYTLELYCYKSPLYAYPEINLTIEAGLTYTLKCENIDGKAKIVIIETKKNKL